MTKAGWGITLDTGRVVGNQLVVTVRMSKWRRRWETAKALSRVRIQVGRGQG